MEKSSKSIIGTAVSGEGMVNVYRGTGEVWLVPTKSIYKDLNIKGLDAISGINPESNVEDL